MLAVHETSRPPPGPPPDRAVDTQMESAGWKELEALAARVAAGDPAGWGELVAGLQPRLLGLAHHQPIGRLRDRGDEVRDIAVAVLAKLHRDDFRVLRSY